MNERVIKRSADDGTLVCRSAECLREPPTVGRYLCSDPISIYYIFTTYESARGITSMIEKWFDKLREIRQGNTQTG